MMRAVMRSLSSAACASACAAFSPMFFQRLMVHCHWRAVAASVLPPAVLQDAGDVVAVQNREVGFEAQHLAVLRAACARPGRERCRSPPLWPAVPIRPLARSRISAAALLVKVMAAMRLGSRPVWISRADLVRDHARLARAGAGQHQAGAVHVVDGFLLGEVQTGGHAGKGRREGGTAEGERRIIPGGSGPLPPGVGCALW